MWIILYTPFNEEFTEHINTYARQPQTCFVVLGPWTAVEVWLKTRIPRYSLDSEVLAGLIEHFWRLPVTGHTYPIVQYTSWV